MLKKVHWLPVSKRIIFKVHLLTFKYKNGIGPTYLSDLRVSHGSGHSPRSETSGLLRISHTKQVTYIGTRHFPKAAPTLWNSIPAQIRNNTSIRSFKNQIKGAVFYVLGLIVIVYVYLCKASVNNTITWYSINTYYYLLLWYLCQYVYHCRP